MITSIILSVLLQLASSSSEWLPTCGATQNQKLLDLISTDIFVRHFNSGVLNSTLTECSNFHRHLCPKEGLPSDASTQGLFDQIVTIERSCTKYDLFEKIQGDFEFANQFDIFDYTNNTSLSTILSSMPKSTLIAIYEYTTLHSQSPTNFYSNIWDLRHWNSTIDQTIFPAKYDSTIFTDSAKLKSFVDSISTLIKNIIVTCGGVAAMENQYLPFLKDVTDYNHVLNVMFRNGFETGATRDRHHDAIIRVTDEYGNALQNATWSSIDSNGESRYDRFYDFIMDIYQNTLHSTLNNIGVQNASLTFPKDFYNFYLEEHHELAPLSILPFLRNIIAVNKAHARTIATADLDLPIRWQIVSSLPHALSGFFVWICVRNQAIFDLVGHNSPDAAVFGVMSYLYGHELYIGGRRDVYPVVMPNSPVVTDSEACVKSFYDDVGQRFPGDIRITYWPNEEEADVYGTQIAYDAFKIAIGSRIDELAYPTLNITQRELFFYANSIFGCNVHDGIYTIFTFLPDAHYMVNGRLAQVLDFPSTFHCDATEEMVFPESEHCPTFFPSYPE